MLALTLTLTLTLTIIVIQNRCVRDLQLPQNVVIQANLACTLSRKNAHCSSLRVPSTSPRLMGTRREEQWATSPHILYRHSPDVVISPSSRCLTEWLGFWRRAKVKGLIPELTTAITNYCQRYTLTSATVFFVIMLRCTNFRQLSFWPYMLLQ